MVLRKASFLGGSGLLLALQIHEDTTTAATFCRGELVPTATDPVSCQRALADCTNHYDPEQAEEGWSCDQVTAETFDCDVWASAYLGCLLFYYETYRAELSCAKLPPPDLAESYPHCAEFRDECPDAARLVKLIPGSG